MEAAIFAGVLLKTVDDSGTYQLLAMEPLALSNKCRRGLQHSSGS